MICRQLNSVGDRFGDYLVLRHISNYADLIVKSAHSQSHYGQSLKLDSKHFDANV